MFFGLVTKHAYDRRTQRQTVWQAERQTDGRNYDSQDGASIAASRGKNEKNVNEINNNTTNLSDTYEIKQQNKILDKNN